MISKLQIILFFSFVFPFSSYAQPGHNLTPYRIWIMTNSDLQFKENDGKLLTPEKILENYNLYIQYVEDSIGNEAGYKLQLNRYNIHDYSGGSGGNELREKKTIPYYLEIPIPPEILPVSLHKWMNKFIPFGSFINLCLEEKATLKRMNIIIRTGDPNELGELAEYSTIHNIVFKEGYFFYDFCLNNFNEQVKLNQINTLIRNPDISGSNIVLDFGIRENLDEFVNNHSIKVSNFTFK